jgi:hypothetical protein
MSRRRAEFSALPSEIFVAQALTVDDRIQVHSSRMWALLTFKITRLLFPARMIADHVGISTNIVEFWLTPWRRTDEHLPMSHIAEVAHTRGFIWDTISIESSGGLNPLVVDGLPKAPARYFVEHVRERINEAAAATPPLQPRH